MGLKDFSRGIFELRVKKEPNIKGCMLTCFGRLGMALS
jgi:hypothetical protein